MGAWHNALREEATREELLQMVFSQRDEMERMRQHIQTDPKRLEAFQVLNEERSYQEGRWIDPARGSEKLASMDEYALYVADYSHQLMHECTRGGEGNQIAKHIIRKIGALCVAAMEHHGSVKR